jgi:(2Fe-2S) ferredoxin
LRLRGAGQVAAEMAVYGKVDPEAMAAIVKAKLAPT